MASQIILHFLRNDVWRTVQTQEFLLELKPSTEIFQDEVRATIKTMRLVNICNLNAEEFFIKCINIIHFHIQKDLDSDIGSRIRINWDESTFKDGVILEDNEPLIKVLSLKPDFTERGSRLY